MPTYVALMKLTEQGLKDIKNFPARFEAAKKGAEAVGGKIIGFYAVLGEYDYVSIAEMPSDEVGMSFMMALGAMGNVRTTTLKAFTEQEFVEIVKKMP